MLKFVSWLFEGWMSFKALKIRKEIENTRKSLSYISGSSAYLVVLVVYFLSR